MAAIICCGKTLVVLLNLVVYSQGILPCIWVDMGCKTDDDAVVSGQLAVVCFLKAITTVFI